MYLLYSPVDFIYEPFLNLLTFKIIVADLFIYCSLDLNISRAKKH